MQAGSATAIPKKARPAASPPAEREGPTPAFHARPDIPAVAETSATSPPQAPADEGAESASDTRWRQRSVTVLRTRPRRDSMNDRLRMLDTLRYAGDAVEESIQIAWTTTMQRTREAVAYLSDSALRHPGFADEPEPAPAALVMSLTYRNAAEFAQLCDRIAPAALGIPAVIVCVFRFTAG